MMLQKRFKKRKKVLLNFVVLSLVFFAFLLFWVKAEEQNYPINEPVKLDLRDFGTYTAKIFMPSGNKVITSDSAFFSFTPEEYGPYKIDIMSETKRKTLEFRVEKNKLDNSVYVNLDKVNVSEPISGEELLRPDSYEEMEILEEGENEPYDTPFVKGSIEVGKDVTWNIKKRYDSPQGDVVKIPLIAEKVDVQGNPETKIEVKESLGDSLANLFSSWEEKSLILSDASGELKISYTTPGPEKEEKELSPNKKEIRVFSPEGFHYERVLVRTTLDNTLPLSQKSKLFIYWKEADSFLPFEAKDVNEDGQIDEISWTAPHLSEQTFEIVITGAIHLDSKYLFLEDIYLAVKDKDGLFGPVIREEEYVRATFEKNLTKENDITLFPRIISGNPKVEVYIAGTQIKIAEFSPLVSETYNKEYLDGLEGSSDSFDLKVVGGSVEFDYITDPTLYIKAGTATIVAAAGTLAIAFAANMPSTSYVPLISGLTDTDSMYSMAYSAVAVTGFTITAEDDQGNGEPGNVDWLAVQYGDASFDGRQIKCGLGGGLAGNNILTFASNFSSTSYAILAISADDTDSPNIGYVAGSKAVNQVTIDIEDDTGTNEVVSGSRYCAFTTGEYTISNLPIKVGSSTTAAAGDTTVSFGSIFASTNYAVIAMAEESSAAHCGAEVVTKNVGSFTIHFEDDGGANCASRNFDWIVIPIGEHEIDAVAPRIFINSPVPNYLNTSNNSVNFRLNLDENGSACYFSIDGGTTNLTMNTSNARSFNYTNSSIPDGFYTASFTCNDTLGNVNNTVQQNFTIDTIKPLISYVSPTEVNNANVSRTWIFVNVSVTEINEKNITFNLYNSSGLVNSTNYTTAVREINWTGLSNGIYWYNVTSYDWAGNTNSTQTYTITLDTTFPLIQFVVATENNNTNWSRNWVFANVTINETNFKNVTFAIYNTTGLVNSTTFTDSTRQINWTGLIEGMYFYNVTAFDSMGNGNATETRTIRLDTTKPNVSFISQTLAGGNYSQSSIWANVSASDGLSGLDRIVIYLYNTTGLVNSTTNATSPAFINWTALPDGTYYLNATANDTARNVNSTETRTIRLDTTKPVLVIVYPTAINYSTNVSTLNYTIIDTTPNRCWYSTDGGTTNSSSVLAGVNFTGVVSSEGWNNWTLYCNDSAGNQNLTNVSFYKDSIFPLIQFVSATENNNTNWSRNWVFANVTINETNFKNVTFSIYNTTGLVNSTTFNDSTRQINWTGLIEGTYRYNVTTWDFIGNRNATETRTIRLDTTSPNVSFVSQTLSAGNYSQSSMWANVSASDGLAGLGRIVIYLYNTTGLVNSTTSATSPFFVNWTGLPDGTYYLNATANDTAGNVNNTETRTIRLDTTRPVLTIVYPTAINYTVNVSELNYTYEDLYPDSCWYSLDNGVTNSSSVTAGVNFTAVVSSEGWNNWALYCNDSVGNRNVTNVSFLRDILNPLIEFISPTEINASNLSKNWIFVNVSLTEIHFKNITYRLYNSTGLINETTYETRVSFINWTLPREGTYYFNVTVWDQFEHVNWTETREVYVDFIAPFISLTYPLNTSNFTGYTVDRFGFIPSDFSPLNCSLWGSWNGGWHLNVSLLPERGIENNYSSLNTSGDGHYLWAVMCNDSFGNINWSDNYTFSTFLPVEALDENSIFINQTNATGYGDVLLSWNITNHADLYRIYYTSNLSLPFLLLNTTSSPNFTDYGPLSERRRFYKISAWNPLSENISSTILGRTLYPLARVAGIGTKNFVGLYLNDSSIPKANNTIYTLENITAINAWNSTLQKRVTCNKFSCPIGVFCTETNCNFDISSISGYEFTINSSSSGLLVNWSYVGRVQNATNISLEKNATSSGKNWVAMYANTTLSSGRNIIMNISVSDSVSMWNASTQSSRGVVPNPFPWIPGAYIGDFVLEPETGIEISVNASTSWFQI